MKAEQLINDISTALAQSAHNGTSFVPERRAEQERSEYAATLACDYSQFYASAVKGGTLDMLDAEFARYRDGYRTRYTAYLHSRSRIVSTFIAGPSNFPARRMNKRSDIADRRLTELIEFRKRARAAILRKLRPDLAPIMAGDSDAVSRLQEQLEKAEKLQARMRAANSVVKKKKLADAEKIAALVAQGFGEKSAAELLQPDFAGRTGFADYQLTNNPANIRRLKGRIAQISTAKATPETTFENKAAGITVEDSPADNRVRIFFPDKPAADVRSRLKSAGFRWAPSLECWQAYRNHSTIAVAKSFAESETA